MTERDVEKMQKELQNLIGSSPRIKVSKFENWGKTQQRDEILSVTPQTVEEVQAVVKGARQLGLRVRAVASGHSWTPLFADEGQVLMQVKEIKRPDGPQIELIQDPDDPNNKLVTMVTGTTTGQFKEFQLSHGVGFSTNVIIREVTMGAVVSSGCHGTGWDMRGVGDYVVSMRIVDSNGDLRTYSMKDDPDMMKAVQCNLGLWGILIDFTMKVEPMLFVQTDTQWIKVKDLFYDKKAMHDLITNNWSVEILWFPFNGISSWEAVEAVMEREVDCKDWDPMEDEIWVRIINKSQSVEEAEPPQTYKSWDLKDWFASKGLDMVDNFVARYPHFAPSFLLTQVNYLKAMRNSGAPVIQHMPHAIHFVNEAANAPVYDMEFAFSLDKDCSNLMTAIQEVVKLVHSEALEGRFPMNLPLEMRFISDTDIYMAPAICGNPQYGGSGHTCFIEVLTLAGTPHWNEFTQRVANIWQKLKGARPHWCKEWEHLEGIDDFIRKSYAQQMPKHLSALERSGADPEGMFFNSHLEKIFYPEGHPGRKEIPNTNDQDVNQSENDQIKHDDDGASDKPPSSWWNSTCHIL